MENAPMSNLEKREVEEPAEELEKDKQRYGTTNVENSVEKRPLEEKGEEAAPPCSAVVSSLEKDAKMAKVDGRVIAPTPAPEHETVLTMDIDEEATNQSPGAGAGESVPQTTSEKVEKMGKEEKQSLCAKPPIPEENSKEPGTEAPAPSVEPKAAQETSKESPCVKADVDVATVENSDMSTRNADASVVTEPESPKKSKMAPEAKADATATIVPEGQGIDNKETSPNTRDPNEETTEASPSPEPVAEDESDQISVDADEDLEIYDDNDTKLQTQLRHTFQHILEEEEPNMDKFIFQRKKKLQMAEACELELDDTTE